jgi:hypothetical protein
MSSRLHRDCSVTCNHTARRSAGPPSGAVCGGVTTRLPPPDAASFVAAPLGLKAGGFVVW